MDLEDAPSSQPRVGTRKLFKLSMFDDKNFALKFSEDLQAEEYNYVHHLVSGFPERKFSRDYESWLIPFSQSTFEYLADKFKPEEYDLDPEAKLVIEYHSKTDRSLALREQNRWQYVFNGHVPTLPFQFHTEPFKHQVVGLDAIHRAEYFGLLMETGTGKTKVVIDELRWVADERQQAGKGPFKVLIVCPKSVRGTWLRELKKHLPEGYNYWACRAHSGIKLIKDLLEGVKADAKLKVWVINYDKLVSGKEALQKLNFDYMVLDESTRIKSPGAKRSKAAREVGETADRRAILTGTPIGNNILDLWSQFHFLMPGCLGYDSFHAYKARYAKVKKIQQWEKITGWQNLDELKARMARCSFVVRKKDCLDLPPKTYVTRSTPMGDRQRVIYDDMLENFIASLADDMGPEGTAQATIILTKLLRLSQICSGFLKPMEGPELPIAGGDVKLEVLEEVLDEMDPDYRLIVWCRFKYDVNAVRKFMDEKKVETCEIHGGIKEADRERAILSFNSDNGARCFIGEPGSGGEGITLLGTQQRPCTTVVYYSNDFSLLKRAQSEARCDRIGMFAPITYIDICCEDSVDEMICERLQQKKDLSEMLKDYESIKRLLLSGRRRTEE